MSVRRACMLLIRAATALSAAPSCSGCTRGAARRLSPTHREVTAHLGRQSREANEVVSRGVQWEGMAWIQWRRYVLRGKQEGVRGPCVAGDGVPGGE